MMKTTNALSLPLDYPATAPLPPVASQPAAATQKLWLCIDFPCFALDVLGVADDAGPHGVLEEKAGRWLIAAACPRAQEKGIEAGMGLNAAYALCPELHAHRRDSLQEQLQLKRLADWACQYSSLVSLVLPRALLLEVGASMSLFGGLPALLRRIQTTLREQWSYHARLAVTPTPLASQVLAQWGQSVVIETMEDLRPLLAKLQVHALPLADDKLPDKLGKTGVRHLQDLWRLPRNALARRFGVELLKRLDQLLGMAEDIRPLHEPPLQFDESRELPAETADKSLLLFALEPLLRQLVTFLQQRDAGINRLLVRLYHYQAPVTQLWVGTRQSTRQYAQLLTLLQQQLDNIRLPEKVCALRLGVQEMVPLALQENRLFSPHVLAETGGCHDPEWESLLEQLQNRLGLEAIRYVDVVDDHRPEYAWCYQAAFHGPVSGENMRRPGWLLHQPLALRLQNGIPCFRGPLRCLWGPERIQSGWWEQQEICRDYYVARDVDNRRLWIYRDLIRTARWYLHGFFA